MKSLLALLISLFLPVSFAAEGSPSAQEAAPLLTAEKLNILQEQAKQPETCPRTELVRFLGSPYLAVRCQALDLLEDMAGDDFGLDPWLEPERVPEEIRQKWQNWATGDRPLANRDKPLTREEAEKAIGILLSSNEKARERICRQLLPHRNEAIIQIESYLQKQASSNDSAKAVLREAQFRLQLDTFTKDAPLLAKKLTGRNRDDIIDSLESLRKGSFFTLPVIEHFLTDKEPLIRETAVDLFLTNGKGEALTRLLPQLSTEKDPNILQVAFRRSLDYPSEDLNDLLVRSAFDNNEEMAITALQCLRDRIKESSIVPIPPRLTDRQWEDLLSHQEWRIRQAALDFLTENQQIYKLGAKLSQRIMDMLQDDDDSVRFSAFRVVAKMPMEGKSALLEEMAFKNPEYMPQILYVLMASDATLSTAMQEMIQRLPEDQVSRLIRQEKELPQMITDSSPNKTTAQVKKNLFKNKNPGVSFQMALLIANRIAIETKPEEWQILIDALSREDYSLEQKRNLTDALFFYRYNSIGKAMAALHQPETTKPRSGRYRLDELSTEQKNTISQIKPYLLSLDTFLKKTRNLYKQTEYEKMAQKAISLLIEYGDTETLTLLEKEFIQFPDDFRVNLAYNICQSDSFDNLKLLELISVDKEKKVRENLFLFFNNLNSSYRPFSSDMSPDELKEKRKKEEQLTAFLDKIFSHPEYGEEHWLNMITERNNLFKNFLFNIKGNYLPILDKYLLSAANKENLHPNQKAMAAFLRGVVKCPDLPENEKVIPEGASPTSKAILTALYDFPTDAELIPEWAEKWSRSPVAEVRQNVAGLLRFTNDFEFYFSDSPTYLIAGTPHTLMEKETPGYEKRKGILGTTSYRRKKGPDCPPKLMETILKLSQDPSAEVSIIANLSLLSNTRRCNVEKLCTTLTECLERQKAQKDDSHVKKLDILLEKAQLSFNNIIRNRIEKNRTNLATGLYCDTQPEKTNSHEISSDEHYLLNLFVDQFFPEEYWSTEVTSKKESPLLITSFRDMVTTENPSVSKEILSGKIMDSPEISASRESADPNEHILVVFFEKPGCSECSRVETSLRKMKRDYPNLRIEKYSITEPKGIEYNALLCSRFHIGQADRLIAPAIFTGDGALMRNRLTDDNLANLIADNSRPRNEATPSGEGIIPEWARHDETGIREAQGDLQNTYTSLSLGVVLLGGLIDGINPCAFATLIFFLSYLQIARRSPRELLVTGGAFVLSVYLTYFAIGLAFHELIGHLQSWSFLKTGMDYLFIFLALLAAALSFRDAWLAKQGRLSDMSLTLPSFLKEKIRAVTRQQSKSRNYIIAAALSGIVISALELACTGQVYAPIIYQIKQGNLPAVGMLAIYNLAFILPLLLIFLLTYKGLKTESLIRFQKKHTFLIKFMLGILFVLLAAIILWGIRL